MKTLIKNGTVFNPRTGFQKKQDVWIVEGCVKEIADHINQEAEHIIDAEGCWVTPGLIDVHVHLREPGFEYKETIETGSMSAAAGGFTTICAMPNTKPVMDNARLVQEINAKIKKESHVHVLPVGAITIGQQGKTVVDVKALAQVGICALSEDGQSVMDSKVLYDAMIRAKEEGLPILSHCEDINLAKGGCMHQGERAKAIGAKGIPSEAEDIIVARDILLANLTGAKLHLCHISTAGSVALLRQAREKGMDVTAEVCPHHFTLTEEAVTADNTNTKMNPPLRSKADLKAIKEGIKDGIINIIATDHAPHAIEDKAGGLEQAANGIVGLETAVPLGITELVEEDILSPMAFIKTLTYNPAKMLGIDKGVLEEGKIADVTIIDPSAKHTIDVHKFHSKSHNSPFHGKQVMGKVTHTIVAGQMVYTDGNL
ncbi:dihydroorotase [Vallitalea pronyensis]|uniref:Dihydroorotase n=1 Tax=Vallitalea pronyensis TaxID=1348613 RepID=A0A8J8MHV7_9FIRM|nr:dihydroorotase [Vallitalea pronyensis]QUI21935.1 dihydroorotase [Vallitalea pronyensis]